MSNKPQESPKDAARLDRMVKRAKTNLLQGKSPRAGFPAKQVKELAERYAQFEDERDADGFLTDSSLLVTRPDTPRPWLHLMSSPHDGVSGVMGSFWDPTGLGCLVYENVRLGTVTSNRDESYSPASPPPTDVRAFYLREEIPGKPLRMWHMLPQVGRDEGKYTDYACRFHPGWMTVESVRNQLHSSLRIFVPVADTAEIWTITLTNLSDCPRKLKLFTRLNWGIQNFDYRIYCLGRYEQDLRAILGVNYELATIVPRAGFMMSDPAFRSFDLSGEAFTGGGHLRLFPRAVVEGEGRNSMGLQPNEGMIGAMHFDLSLRPGSSRSVNIIVGKTDPKTEHYRRHLKSLRKRYFTLDGVEKEFRRAQEAWKKELDSVQLSTPDAEIDRTYNVWLKYQVHNTARFNRSGEMMGYRDALQDMMGLCDFDPGYARNFLPVVLNHQLRDGRAIRQFFKLPSAKAPQDERMYADSPAWIPDTLVSYLEETGDFDILDEQVGFYDLDTHRVDNSVTKSVYEHTLLAMESLFRNRGQRGLCLIGHGDWNDSMDGLSKRGQGVSGWLSMALVFAAQRLLRLTSWLGDAPNTALMERIIATMTEAINTGAWDGNHYVFGFNDDGVAVGSDSNEEGRIHCPVNAWSLFSGVAAAAGRVDQVLSAMERLWTPLGTNTIDMNYTQKSRQLAGRICDLAPGQFENGGLYTHGHSFLLYGLACSGLPDRAYREMKNSLPENTFPDITTGPPHQMSNFAVGPSSPNYGLTPYSNFTGAANWYLKTLRKMAGVIADFDGLRIAPAAPREWREYQLRKRFRGADYHFRFHHKSGTSKVRAVTVNGKPLDPINGEFKVPLPAKRTNRPIDVEVQM